VTTCHPPQLIGGCRRSWDLGRVRDVRARREDAPVSRRGQPRGGTRLRVAKGIDPPGYGQLGTSFNFVALEARPFPLEACPRLVVAWGGGGGTW
jgi:hypothetical protein